MAISKFEQQLLFECSIELGAVQFIEAHHNPPALQLLGGPELACCADLQQLGQHGVRLAEGHGAKPAALLAFRPLGILRGNVFKAGFSFFDAQMQLGCEVLALNAQQGVADFVELVFALEVMAIELGFERLLTPAQPSPAPHHELLPLLLVQALLLLPALQGVGRMDVLALTPLIKEWLALLG